MIISAKVWFISIYINIAITDLLAYICKCTLVPMYPYYRIIEVEYSFGKYSMFTTSYASK
jgi:hypothetical protein